MSLETIVFKINMLSYLINVGAGPVSPNICNYFLILRAGTESLQRLQHIWHFGRMQYAPTLFKF